MSNFKKLYDEQIVPDLIQKLHLKTRMQVPKIDKIVINMGIGDGAHEAKFITSAEQDLKAITGQKPVITKARKSIAGFKLRAGQPIGVKVTLRGENMYYFLERLVKIALPRVRDFRGISPNSFDGKGNYTLGVKEQLVFPEIEYDNVVKIRGMNLVLVTTAKSNQAALELLRAFGMPFRE